MLQRVFCVVMLGLALAPPRQWLVSALGDGLNGTTFVPTYGDPTCAANQANGISCYPDIAYTDPLLMVGATTIFQPPFSWQR